MVNYGLLKHSRHAFNSRFNIFFGMSKNVNQGFCCQIWKIGDGYYITDADIFLYHHPEYNAEILAHWP